MRFPVLVKPIQHDRLISSFGAKLFLARDRAELATATERLHQAGLPGLVFDFVPGPDSNLYVYCVYVDARGEPSPGVTVRKLRQHPPVIGGARVAEIAPEIPVLREATVELLRRAGFRGMAFAEFKRDPRTGRFSFIEVNGRAVQFNSILPPTGVDLTGDGVVRLRAGPAARGCAPPAGREAGSISRRTSAARSPTADQERLSLAEFAAPYRRPKTFAVWSRSDPRPYLAQTRLGLRSSSPLWPAAATPAPDTRDSTIRNLPLRSRSSWPSCAVVGRLDLRLVAQQRPQLAEGAIARRRERRLVHGHQLQLEATQVVLDQLVLQDALVVLEHRPDPRGCRCSPLASGSMSSTRPSTSDISRCRRPQEHGSGVNAATSPIG